MVRVKGLVGLAFLDAVRFGGDVNEGTHAIRLTDEQRIDWLRLIRSQNVGPRGIMAQTPEAFREHPPR